MTAAVYLVLGAALTLGALKVWDQFWSFRAQRPKDYAAERPAFDLRTALAGRYTAHGAIFDFSGRANVRFSAEIVGTFDDEGGTLAERFRYDNMNQVDAPTALPPPRPTSKARRKAWSPATPFA